MKRLIRIGYAQADPRRPGQPKGYKDAHRRRAYQSYLRKCRREKGAAPSGTLEALSKTVDQLVKGLAGTSAASLIPRLQEQSEAISGLASQIAREGNLPGDKYIDAAWKELAPGHRALDVLLHDLNIYSISPVAMVDAARVWPVGEGESDPGCG